ncbi:MAG: calcium/proton exchanger [Planctomycetia bacterium]|nr:calcium/proton exchanger [Planctomycetia bacterium]
MKLNYLLIFIPIAILLDWIGWNPLIVFITSALAIIPLASLMGTATEVLARYLGPTFGGLLNATLGNAPEIIISILALHKGLYDVVKASITGSIIGNLLFGLGVAMIFGGLKHGIQKFDRVHAGMSAGLMQLAAVGLLIPALFEHLTTGEQENISIETAVVLLIVYILSIVFMIRRAKKLKAMSIPEPLSPVIAAATASDTSTVPADPSRPGNGSVGPDDAQNEIIDEREALQRNAETESTPSWSRNQAIGLLTLITVGLAVVSETLTGAIEPASELLGLTPIFSGVILLAMVGNAAELYNAVRFARANQMDLTFGICAGAGSQVALLVAPVLVFVSLAMGDPLNLVFSPFEVAAVAFAVLINARITSDGECHWMEGVLLVGVWILVAIGFFNL